MERASQLSTKRALNFSKEVYTAQHHENDGNEKDERDHISIFNHRKQYFF